MKGLIINYDRDEFVEGKSRYGEGFQIEVNRNKLNEPEYYSIVLKAMNALKKKTTKYRKENTIVYHNRKQERIDRLSQTVLTIRHTEDNKILPAEPYNKWLTAVIKRNEKARENIIKVTNILKIQQ